jgi:signal transduction histidine kinase/CheY-like chemotaxis protein
MTDAPKILIVDDKPENLYALEKLLDKLDVQVIQACSGTEALSLIVDHDFCVAIIDIQMPEMDGYELVELLRGYEATTTLPVIFVSAIYSDEYHHRKGYEAGAVDFMSKPFIPEILLSKVRVFIDLYQQRKTLQERNEDLQELSFQLQEQKSDLLKLTDELEDKNTKLVKLTDELMILTDDLRDANMNLSKRAVQLEASNQVGQQVTSLLNQQELLTAIVKLIQAKFGYYFVGVLLLDEPKKSLVLQASTGGDESLLAGQKLIIDPDNESGIIAWVGQTGQAYLANDVSQDSRYLALAALPQTRAELALPLLVGDDLMGVLDIQSNQLAVFNTEDQRVLQTLANQIAIAIRNARLYEMEKRLNTDKDRFFSIISHDLRGPFTSLLGNAQFMMEMIDNLKPQDIREMAEGIYNAGKSAYNLLDNLLTWSRMQRQGGMEYHPDLLELRLLAEETVNLLAPRAADKQIELRNTIAVGQMVYADKYMLDTVIRNLAGNALKFTPRGGQITLSAHNNSTQTGRLTVAITDTGIGMNEADIAKLFRIDVNHSTIGTDREQGSGLGLIICQEMIERHDGKIWVESAKGHGTTVSFSIPLTDQPSV